MDSYGLLLDQGRIVLPIPMMETIGFLLPLEVQFYHLGDMVLHGVEINGLLLDQAQVGLPIPTMEFNGLPWDRVSSQALVKPFIRMDRYG
jgi:hypothetical protein